jgi:hypothetical protein
MVLMIERWTPCLKASQWLMMNRSLDRSQFKVASEYFSKFRIGAFIYYNYFLIFSTFFLNVCSLIAIHHIRHSNSERETGFAPISNQISIPCAERVTASTRICKILVEDMLNEKRIIYKSSHISEKIICFLINVP